MAVWAKKMVAKKAGLYMEEWLTGYRWGRGGCTHQFLGMDLQYNTNLC